MTSEQDQASIKAYCAFQIEEAAKILETHESLIQRFIETTQNEGLSLVKGDFDYIPAIGVIARKKGIMELLCKNVLRDKEGLYLIEELKEQYIVKSHIPGYLYSEEYMAMPHPFFRRGFSGCNNYAPRLIEILWRLNDDKIELSLALDPDRIRIDVSDSIYMEFDTWYGPKFTQDIMNIEDGVCKLAPPCTLKPEYASFLFNDAFCLDVIWETKGRIRSFQAEEFKAEGITVNEDGKLYYPVRYIHAEYDPDLGAFRHFDGAIHLYEEEEYFLRRSSDFNFFRKGVKHMKPKSLKLFKMNGEISVDRWVEYCSHFCSGNPLIIEYFTGKYSDWLQDTLNKIEHIGETT